MALGFALGVAFTIIVSLAFVGVAVVCATHESPYDHDEVL